MMELEEQLKLQAYLDGELSESEARAISGRLEQDTEASTLLSELRQTRSALGAFGNELRVPETREFYWSKIQREIQRQANPAPLPEPAPSWLVALRRLLMPVTAAAMVLLVTFMVGKQSLGGPSRTAIRDSGAITYHDFEKGATLVWLSYPAENDFVDYEAAMWE